tara:strand:- start:701 stop:1024 length:324 start_codon:yes stop_codon:yes gene_type:complete
MTLRTKLVPLLTQLKNMKISESTEFKIDIKTVVSIIVITSMFMTMYFTLQADIEEAKKMPPAVIDRIEYDLKQQWQTEHIEDLEEKVDEILFWCKEMDGKIKSKKDR